MNNPVAFAVERLNALVEVIENMDTIPDGIGDIIARSLSTISMDLEMFEQVTIFTEDEARTVGSMEPDLIPSPPPSHETCAQEQRRRHRAAFALRGLINARQEIGEMTRRERIHGGTATGIMADIRLGMDAIRELAPGLDIEEMQRERDDG